MKSNAHAVSATSLMLVLVNREVQRLFWTAWTLFLSAVYTGMVAAGNDWPAAVGWIALVPTFWGLFWCRRGAEAGLREALRSAGAGRASWRDSQTFRWFAMTLAFCNAATFCLFAAVTGGYLFDDRTESAVVAGVGAALLFVGLWMHVSDMEAGFRAVGSMASEVADERSGADPRGVAVREAANRRI